MSVISSGTTLTTALVQTGDTNGNLVFKTGASGTTALTLGSDQSATFAGAVSFGTSAFAAGSAAAPSITFTGDTNTGIYSPAADTIAFTEGGVESMRIDSSGNVGIGTSSPARRVDARSTSSDYQYRAGDSANPVLSYDFGRENTGGLFKFYGNQTGATGYIFDGVDGERMRITTTGNVGIGTSSPSARLQVEAPVAQLYLTSSTGTNLCLYRAINTGGTFFIGRENSTGSNFGIAYSALLWSTGAYPMVFATNDVARMRIASDGGIFSQPTGGGTLLEQFGCRAWVNFDGTGTVAIRASGNVSSITDNGTGDYTINFTTALTDANYNICGSAQEISGTGLPVLSPFQTSPATTSSLRVRTANASVTLVDPAIVSVSIFR
jgi:hypothetical protein